MKLIIHIIFCFFRKYGMKSLYASIHFTAQLFSFLTMWILSILYKYNYFFNINLSPITIASMMVIIWGIYDKLLFKRYYTDKYFRYFSLMKIIIIDNIIVKIIIAFLYVIILYITTIYSIINFLGKSG
jgi:hypothetical protein